jgi:hypothetical protein
MSIKFVHNDNIDRKLWDRKIAQSIKSPIFNFSWYLDVLDQDWFGFIKDDYEWVLPFFAENRQVFMPYWLPYLSVSSLSTIGKIEKEFIENFWAQNYTSIEHRFSKYQFQFAQSQLTEARPFYQQDLINDYNVLAYNFKPEVNTNLDIASQKALRTISFRSLYEYIEFSEINNPLESDKLNTLRRIILKASQLNTGKMYAVYNATNQIIAVAFILFFKNRAYIMHASFSEEGLASKADYLLINNLIKDLSLYNISLENHSSNISEDALLQFRFGLYYSYEFRQNPKQNMLSLLLQFLRK